jgi:hypothetical protein
MRGKIVKRFALRNGMERQRLTFCLAHRWLMPGARLVYV